MNDNISHKEILLTNEFIHWLIKTRNYIELFEDSDTSGSDPFDSAGYIENELILIEFKDNISKGMVLYKNSKGSSIEKKIGQVLKQIYRKEDARIYNSISSFYTKDKIPNALIVANRISENALKLLIKVIEERQKEWFFNAEIIVWKNKNGKTLYKNKSVNIKTKPDLQIEFPEFKNTALKRKDKLNLKEVEGIFKTINKLEEFEMFIKYCKEIGANISFNITNLNVKLNKTIFGIWPFESNIEKGIRITFNIEQINKELNSNITNFNDLNIIRNENKLGYLGHNAFVKNKVEMQNLIMNLSK